MKKAIQKIRIFEFCVLMVLFSGCKNNSSSHTSLVFRTTGGSAMNKILMITLIFLLTATIFTGCRKMGNTTPSTGVPTSSSTKSTVVPMPEIPLPSGTNTTAPQGSNGVPEDAPPLPSRMRGPAAKGPRYEAALR